LTHLQAVVRRPAVSTCVIYRATAPDPDRRTAPPGASRYRFSLGRLEFIEKRPPTRPANCTTGCFARPRLQTRLVLLVEGTESLATNTRSTDGGHRRRGGGFWRRKFGRSLFFSFLFLFLVAQAEGYGRCHRARSWALHVPGRDCRQEYRLKVPAIFLFHLCFSAPRNVA